MSRRKYFLAAALLALHLAGGARAGELEELGRHVDSALDEIGPKVMRGLGQVGQGAVKLGDQVAASLDGGLRWISGGFEDLSRGEPTSSRNAAAARRAPAPASSSPLGGGWTSTTPGPDQETTRRAPITNSTASIASVGNGTSARVDRVAPRNATAAEVEPWFRVTVPETGDVIDVVMTPDGNHTWIDGEWIGPGARLDDVRPEHLELLFALRSGSLTTQIERME